MILLEVVDDGEVHIAEHFHHHVEGEEDFVHGVFSPVAIGKAGFLSGFELVFHDGYNEFVFVGIMLVDRFLADAEACGDIIHTHAPKAELHEHRMRFGQYTLRDG